METRADASGKENMDAPFGAFLYLIVDQMTRKLLADCGQEGLRIY